MAGDPWPRPHIAAAGGFEGPPTITSMRFSRALKDAPTTTSPRIHRSVRRIWSVALSRIP